MSENKVPKYAHLEYQVLHDLEISIAEYFLLDMIYRLTGNGSRWCNKRLENIAFDMRLSRKGVIQMRDRLIERKLLKKGVGNRLLTTEKVHKVYFLDENALQKSALSSKKVHKGYKKSALSSSKTSVENNKRITKNSNAVNFRGTESPAKEHLRAWFKEKVERGL